MFHSHTSMMNRDIGKHGLITRWDPVHGTKSGAEIPSNFTPGVMSVLDQILTRSVAKGITRSAVLARDAIHIKSSFPFDIGESLDHL
jgi:hypothetical protein